MKYYMIYGLTVASQITFPEAWEIDVPDEIDVEVVYGPMPDYIQAKKDKGYLTSIRGVKHRWFYFENEGDFLIEHGNKVTIKRHPNADEAHIRSLALGAGLGSALFQKDILALHGGAVVLDNQAIVVSGRCGAGKSTLVTALRNQGCLFLADDTVALVKEEGRFMAQPAYPQQKLCKDAALNFGLDLTQLVKLEEEREKYAVKVRDIFCNEPKPLNTLVIIEKNQEEVLEITEVQGTRKLEYFINNLYSVNNFKMVGMSPELLKLSMQVVESINIIHVKRPSNQMVAEEVAKKICSMVKETVCTD